MRIVVLCLALVGLAGCVAPEAGTPVGETVAAAGDGGVRVESIFLNGTYAAAVGVADQGCWGVTLAVATSDNVARVPLDGGAQNATLILQASGSPDMRLCVWGEHLDAALLAQGTTPLTLEVPLANATHFWVGIHPDNRPGTVLGPTEWALEGRVTYAGAR